MSLFDCFKWALIDCIVKCRGHSELWQFQRGGVHLPLVSTCFLYALEFPYIFLLFDCFEWALIDCIEKHRGHSELWQFQTGGTICLWYLYPYIYWYFLIFSNKLTAFGIYMFSLHWYFLISSYYLTVSNGCSLTALKSVEVTQSSDSFIWGEGGPPWTH